jgi:rhomboid protease GluP
VSEGDRVRLHAAWLAAATIVATWIAALAIGVDPTAPSPGDLIGLGGNYAPRTRDGQWWRLVTAATVHAGAVHLAINAAALLVLGTLLEQRLGAAATVAVLVGATLIASAASLAWSPYTVSVGASGALSGVCGALGVELARGTWPRTRRIVVAAAVAAFLAWGLVLAAISDGVDHAAHGAGLAAGVAIALPGRRRAGLGLAAALAATILLVWLARPPVDIRARAAEILAIEARYDKILDGVGLRADGPRLARTLEEEVLVPLRAAAARLVVDERLPSRELRFATSLAAYTAARIRALELYVRHLESGDPALLPEIERFQAAARAAGAGLTDGD